jgi:glutaredoxin
MFRATSLLRDCRITFFTRSPCGLCDTAKAVVQNVKAKRQFEYEEINVMEPGQEKWKSAYEFDTPVVSPRDISPPSEYLSVAQVHVDRAGAETTTSSLKLMHRFKEAEIVHLIDDAERS